MPTYRYRCEAGHEMSVWASIHAETIRRRACSECGCTALLVLPSPMIAAGALPSRMGDVVEIDQRERRWSRDMDAYRRLRADGLQPPRIDGAAVLEQEARTRYEVESGRILGREADRADEVDSAVKAGDL